MKKVFFAGMFCIALMGVSCSQGAKTDDTTASPSDAPDDDDQNNDVNRSDPDYEMNDTTGTGHHHDNGGSNDL